MITRASRSPRIAPDAVRPPPYKRRGGPGEVSGTGAAPSCAAGAAERSGAGGLAAARDVHLLLERVEADRADHHLGAHHIARRAVEAEGLGDPHVLLDRGAHLVARHVLLDARDVEPGLLGGRER